MRDAEAEELWEGISLILKQEVNEELTAREVYAKAKDAEIRRKLEEMDLPVKIEKIGNSNSRRDRIIFCSVLLGLYGRLVEEKTGKGEEILEYVEERIKDVEKRIRSMCLMFLLEHTEILEEEGILEKKDIYRKTVKTLISLLKNKRKSIRRWYIGTVHGNVSSFLSLIPRISMKSLEKTLILLVKYSFSCKEHSILKKAAEIFCFAVKTKRLPLSSVSQLLGSFSLQEVETLSLSKKIYKVIEKEVSKEDYIVKIQDTKKEGEEEDFLSSNLLWILEWSICKVQMSYLFYSDIFNSEKLNVLQQCTIARMLRKSPFSEEKKGYLKWTEEKIEEKIEESSTEEVLPLFSLYVEYAADQLVDSLIFSSTAERVFSLFPDFRKNILSLLVPLANMPNDPYFPLIQSLSISIVSSISSNNTISVQIQPNTRKEEESEANQLISLLSSSFNPFIYTPSNLLQHIYNRTNRINFYIILWYIFSCNPKNKVDVSSYSIASIRIDKPKSYKEFSLFFESFTIFYSIRHSFPLESEMDRIFKETEDMINEYINEKLSHVRESRAYLVSSYEEMSSCINLLINLLSGREENQKKTSLYLLKNNSHQIVMLLIYLINTPLYPLLSVCLKALPKDHLPNIPIEDKKRLEVYGILTAQGKARLKEYNAFLTDRKEDPDISSVSEISLSRNLDTKILDGIMFQENKEE
ncbi:hypothetical protein NEFER03_0614 [Nematocida sp. LUAm3]|nr:hypothetical protein NEFER03_0614 [Nematocida sp. LUAm3]